MRLALKPGQGCHMLFSGSDSAPEEPSCGPTQGASPSLKFVMAASPLILLAASSYARAASSADSKVPSQSLEPCSSTAMLICHASLGGRWNSKASLQMPNSVQPPTLPSSHAYMHCIFRLHLCLKVWVQCSLSTNAEKCQLLGFQPSRRVLQLWTHSESWCEAAPLWGP